MKTNKLAIVSLALGVIGLIIVIPYLDLFRIVNLNLREAELWLRNLYFFIYEGFIGIRIALLFSLPGLIIGIVGRRRVKTHNEKGLGLANFGVVLSLVTLATALFFGWAILMLQSLF